MSEAPQTPTHQALGNSQPLVAEGITPGTTQKRKASPLERFTPPKTLKPPLEEDAPIIDGSVFEAFGFPTPTNHCVLSIYEQVESEEQLARVSKELPSPVGGKDTIKKTVRASNSIAGDDLYVLSVQSKQETDDMVIMQLEGSYGHEALNALYSKKRWVQSTMIIGPDGFAYRVLILFKSRIYKHRLKF